MCFNFMILVLMILISRVLNFLIHYKKYIPVFKYFYFVLNWSLVTQWFLFYYNNKNVLKTFIRRILLPDKSLGQTFFRHSKS